MKDNVKDRTPVARADRPGTPPSKPVVLALVGEDGNAFFIIGRLRTALKRAGADKTYIDDVTRDATSGDYDHVLAVALAESEAENADEEDDDDLY